METWHRLVRVCVDKRARLSDWNTRGIRAAVAEGAAEIERLDALRIERTAESNHLSDALTAAYVREAALLAEAARLREALREVHGMLTQSSEFPEFWEIHESDLRTLYEAHAAPPVDEVRDKALRIAIEAARTYLREGTRSSRMVLEVALERLDAPPPPPGRRPPP